MEVTTEIREDPSEEIAESSLSARAGYGWVAEDVRTQHSLFIWSQLLKSWLNCIPVLERSVWRDIVALERVNAIDCVCHGHEGASEEFFYMYMCDFSQLYVRLPFNDFTMGVLRLLNVAPTQLHPNSWAYLQDFRVVVKEPRRSYFYNTDGSTKFPFNWTDNPWHYKDMKGEKFSLADREVVETLMDHMAQLGKKNLNLFQTLRKEKAAKAKSAENTKVPNLQDPLVEVHVHGGTKRKVDMPTKQGGGKDVKR
ncbi:hypothetical protein DEO72_LG3g1094 [Vigna unguiculata]|uniref:Transposase n=1 Tax=Vigna unguiculata TaxID=3917 RepID=A0A4D6LDJ7_VIGUN|nr:hypothetical protein DEO72_LG3g1094 [Vigna unguiculata]